MSTKWGSVHIIRMTGCSREEIVGMHVSERDVYEDHADARRHIDDILGDQGGRFFTHHLRADGSSIPLEVSTRPIETDAGPALISFCHDLSELHGARQSIAEEEQLRKDLIAQVPGAIYQFQYFPDGSSRFPIASPNIWLVYEVTPEEVSEDATAAFQRIHPDDYDTLVKSIVHSRDTLTVWEHDYRVILPSRGERWLRGRAKPEALEDGSVLWHGHITDVTDRKRADRDREQAMRTQKTLMEELNHRVKNNLSMVVSLIRLKRADNEALVDLHDLESRVQAIATLHEELQQSAELDRVATHGYVERVVGHALSAASIPVEVELDIADEEIPTSTATTLGLIINELATNAIKHGFDRAAGARFSLTLTRRTGYDELVVRNNGRHFPDDVTVETSNTMGLQLVTSLVQQLGGKLRLERSPDTTFFITYPHPKVGGQEP
jgi:PAS domain S-box-containing protein